MYPWTKEGLTADDSRRTSNATCHWSKGSTRLAFACVSPTSTSVVVSFVCLSTLAIGTSVVVVSFERSAPARRDELLFVCFVHPCCRWGRQ